MKKEIHTHERCFEEVLGHKNLIGGVNNSTLLDPTLLNLQHAIHTRQQHHENGPCNGLHHQGSTTSLQPIQAHYHELPQRGLEQQQRYHRSLRKYHREQKLNHLPPQFRSPQIHNGIREINNSMGPVRGCASLSSILNHRRLDNHKKLKIKKSVTERREVRPTTIEFQGTDKFWASKLQRDGLVVFK